MVIISLYLHSNNELSFRMLRINIDFAHNVLMNFKFRVYRIKKV